MLATNKFYATWYNKSGSKIAVIEFMDSNGNWRGSHAYDYNPYNKATFADQVYAYADTMAGIKGGRMERCTFGGEE